MRRRLSEAALLVTLLVGCKDGGPEGDDTSGQQDGGDDGGETGTADGGTTATLPSGLIAHWAFDEGAGTTAADSTGAHDGTLVNGPTWTEGRSGWAILFDGTDDVVDIPDHADFDIGTGDFTVAAWFKTTNKKDHHVVNLRQNDNDPHIELYACPPPFGYLGTHLLPGDVRISYDQPVADGAWHHAAVVLENGVTDGYRLYFESNLVGTNTYTGALEDWDTVHIGAGGDNAYAFDGSIDEVMIFGRALSEAEVQQVYAYTADR